MGRLPPSCEIILLMNKIFELGLMVIAVIAVAIADVLTKKIAFTVANYETALRNPLLFLVVALYLLQIGIFLFLFVKKAELGVVGVVQTALFAVIVIGSGVLFFNEKISTVQTIGMGLAIVGAVLTSL